MVQMIVLFHAHGLEPYTLWYHRVIDCTCDGICRCCTFRQIYNVTKSIASGSNLAIPRLHPNSSGETCPRVSHALFAHRPLSGYVIIKLSTEFSSGPQTRIHNVASGGCILNCRRLLPRLFYKTYVPRVAYYGVCSPHITCLISIWGNSQIHKNGNKC